MKQFAIINGPKIKQKTESIFKFSSKFNMNLVFDELCFKKLFSKQTLKIITGKLEEIISSALKNYGMNNRVDF